MGSPVVTWPAPDGEVPSPDFTVEVNGCPLFVYQARVRAEILQNEGLWTHAPDCSGERTSFALCDITAPVTVTVHVARPFHTAVILPARAGIATEVVGECVRFTVDRPQHLTLLLDESDLLPLHLFIGAPEEDVPQPDDPNVLYFGPGVHEINNLAVQSGQTVYLAGGAVVKGVLRPGEVGEYNEQWKVNFYHGSVLTVEEATGVRICGRGILDGSVIPHPGHNMVKISNSSDVRLSGIVLRDAANWNVIIQQSQQILVDDLRIISGRLNSDGINSVNSQHVAIRQCFVRNHDDSIAVKAVQPDMPSEDILVEDCVIWNDWGYALGATYETRSPIRRVTFRRCDILFSRHWSLGVRVADSATVSEITFTDITIAPHTSPATGPYTAATTEPKLFSAFILQDCWGQDSTPGRVRQVRIEDVTIYGDRMLPSEIFGIDAEHDIRDVTFRNVHLYGQPPVTDADALRLTTNEFAQEIHISK